MKSRWHVAMDRWIVPLVLLLGLSVLLLAVNWPWPRFFTTSFVHHWDPPFHAWKLMLAARSIQAGHILPLGGNSNCFFPSSLTFYYEALHWPQAVFAALAFQFTDNPVLVYHATLLAFWSLSGVCFFWLLRELRIGRSTAVLGAVVFCILPYRMLYFVEFNMQLCVGLVLSLLFGMRFFTHRGFWSGVAFGLAFWFQAASELYQTLIFTMLAPFLFASFLVERNLWRDRRFWLGVVGFAATLPLTFYFLYGYAVLHYRDGMARGLMEISHHTLEPFSFLVSPGNHRLWHWNVRTDETSVNPTWPILLLALAYAWFARWRPAKARVPRFFTMRRVRLGAIVLAVAMLAVLQEYPVGFGRATAGVFNLVMLVVLGSVVAVQLAAPRVTAERRLIAGLGSAACVAFLLSFGPTISLGNGLLFKNWAFCWTYATVPLLSGMRVVSRFAIIVNIFVLVAAMAAWDGLRRRWHPLIWLAPLLPVVVLLSQPLGHWVFDTCDWAPSSPVVAAARKEGRPLLFVPFGDRYYDSRNMLAIGRHDLPMLYGWGGFYPRYQRQLLNDMRAGDADGLVAHVGEVWPDARILVDKRQAAAADERERHDAVSRFVAHLLERCQTLGDDPDYTLLAVNPPTNAILRCVRQTRRDILENNPYVRLTARGTIPGQRLYLRVNGAWAAELELASSERTYVFYVPGPLRLRVHLPRVEAISTDETPWFLRDCRFSDQLPRKDEVAVELSALPVPWPAALDEGPEIPGPATPADIRFANGLYLRAVTVPAGQVQAGDTVFLTTYWEVHPDAKIGGRVAFLHAKEGRSILFQADVPVLFDIPSRDIRCQTYRKVFSQDIPLVIPETTPPGIYTLKFGLLQPGGARIAGRSALPSRRREFRLPLDIHVEETRRRH